jgi:cell division transport system ATP-binding protein
VPEILEMVGLSNKLRCFPEQLSGGEQQRVCIARALVHAPPLLVADEPTGNLDPCTSAEIFQLLNAIHGEGTTVVVATHDASIVDRMQKRVMAFEAGRLVRDDHVGGYDLDQEAFFHVVVGVGPLATMKPPIAGL